MLHLGMIMESNSLSGSIDVITKFESTSLYVSLSPIISLQGTVSWFGAVSSFQFSYSKMFKAFIFQTKTIQRFIYRCYPITQILPNDNNWLRAFSGIFSMLQKISQQT